MKRFFADAFLIFALVSIASYVGKSDESKTQEKLQKQVEKFEENIALQKKIKEPKQTTQLNEIEENKAGELAKKSSKAVIDTMEGAMSLLNQVIQGVTK